MESRELGFVTPRVLSEGTRRGECEMYAEYFRTLRLVMSTTDSGRACEFGGGKKDHGGMCGFPCVVRQVQYGCRGVLGCQNEGLVGRCREGVEEVGFGLTGCVEQEYDDIRCCRKGTFDVVCKSCYGESSYETYGSYVCADTREDCSKGEFEKEVEFLKKPGVFGGVQGTEVPPWRVKTLPRGPNYERNQRNREAKKRSKRGEIFKREVGVPSELRESWIERKNAENKLAVLKAEKDMAYQRSRDSEAEAKARRISLVKKTEKDKVAVEKAFSTLKSTGNVPGFCETVVSGEPSLSEGEIISPSSSISNAEIRELQKKLLDSERQVKLLMLANRQEVEFSVDENGSLPGYVKEDLKKAEDEDFEHTFDNDGDEYEGIKPKHIYVSRRCFISTDRDFEGFGEY